MIRSASSMRCSMLIVVVMCLLPMAGCVSHGKATAFSVQPSSPDAPIVIRVATGQHADAFAAGKTAAEALQAQMDPPPYPPAIIMTECFEEEADKQAALQGVTSVFPKCPLVGFATYGSFGQGGCLDTDAVCLMGIGGGVTVSAALKENLGIAGLTMENDLELLKDRLHTAGASLANTVPMTPKTKLVMVMADAHSPKNQFLVEGVQSVVGKQFPITGGSANKNAGQTYVYFDGKMYEDSAVALALTGDFTVVLSGRQAKSNDKVISTAKEAAVEALENLQEKPFAAIAFNCAGRKGKLDNLEDELAAFQQAIGKDIPLFGCYCAGEIGPADVAEKDPDVLSSGMGWHVMFTLLGQ